MIAGGGPSRATGRWLAAAGSRLASVRGGPVDAPVRTQGLQRPDQQPEGLLIDQVDELTATVESLARQMAAVLDVVTPRLGESPVGLDDPAAAQPPNLCDDSRQVGPRTRLSNTTAASVGAATATPAEAQRHDSAFRNGTGHVDPHTRGEN